jgi:hypothetical protein
MTSAERLAALKAIQSAIGDAIDQATKDVELTRAMTGAKSFDTRIGTVSWTVRKPTVTFDDAALLVWAKENMPHEVEVVERVRDTLKTTLQKRLYAEDDGTVWDSTTGELVEWAHIKPGSEYATVRLTQEAKDNARTAILANLDTVTGVLTAGVTERGAAA